MAKGQYLYLSAATVEAIASKGRADLLAGYMVLADHRQGRVSGYTTAGARAIGDRLGLGISERSEIVRELKAIPITHTSGAAVTAVMDTVELNLKAGTEYPLKFGAKPTLGLPENKATSTAGNGYAWVPTTIVRGLNGAESQLKKIMALPRTERLPALMLMVRFFQHYRASLGAFDPRYTVWEEPDESGKNYRVKYGDKVKKAGFINWVIPASSTRTAYISLIDEMGGNDIFWQALKNLCKFGIIRRALVVCDADPTKHGDAETLYTLYEKNLSSGTTEGIYNTTMAFCSDFNSYAFFGKVTHKLGRKGTDSLVVVTDSLNAMPIWLYKPVHDVGTEETAAAKLKQESRQAAWQDRIKLATRNSTPF